MIVAVGAIAAGMLGVGGGMILGPIFLELGIIPQVRLRVRLRVRVRPRVGFGFERLCDR